MKNVLWGQYKVWGGMAVHACVPSYSATWHPFYSPTHRQMQHRDPEQKGEKRGQQEWVVKTKEENQVVRQLSNMYADSTTAGKLTPTSKMLPKLQ